MRTHKLKSLLRYPGGKSRAVPFLWRFVPDDIREYREPMVGGGAMMLAMRQLRPEVNCWIGDVNPELICFWRAVQTDAHLLVARIEAIQQDARRMGGRELYNRLRAEYGQGDLIQRAARFYVLNRISYSGFTDAGGYSEHSFQRFLIRRTHHRILCAQPLLQSVKITEGDYEPILLAEGDRVLIFLDPPYADVPKPKLYGKDGIHHAEFDHTRLAQTLRQCPHRWFMTYDDSPRIRELYHPYDITEWSLHYSIRASRGKSGKIGKEIVITNGA